MSQQENASARTKFYLVGIVLVAVVAAAVVYLLSSAAPEVEEARLRLESPRGNPDATITVVQYSTYGCTICRDAHQNGMFEQLVLTHGEYIRFVFRNAASMAANDELASESTQCALDQDNEQFWMMHDAIWDLSADEYADVTNVDDFVALGEGAGVDGEALRSCLENNTHERTIQYWQDDAASQNVTGTPVFFVNDLRLANGSQLDESILDAVGEG